MMEENHVKSRHGVTGCDISPLSRVTMMDLSEETRLELHLKRKSNM